MTGPIADPRSARRWLQRAGVAVLVAALGALALWTQQSIVTETAQSDATVRLAAAYQDARFWVGQEELLERKYRLHDEAERRLTADLRRVARIDPSAATKRFVAGQLEENQDYTDATKKMFASVRAADVVDALLRVIGGVWLEPAPSAGAAVAV